MEWDMDNTSIIDYNMQYRQKDYTKDYTNQRKVDIENFIVTKSSDFSDEIDSMEYMLNNNSNSTSHNSNITEINSGCQHGYSLSNNFFLNKNNNNFNYINYNKINQTGVFEHNNMQNLNNFERSNHNANIPFKDSQKKIIFQTSEEPKIPTEQDDKDCFIFSNNNMNNNSNFEHVDSYKGLSLSERMKKKKEKTKILLERKTKRNKQNDNLNNSNDNCNNTCNDNKNTQKNGDSQNNQQSQLQSKKEIKMVRNRLSAQRSRDRKKKEFDDLKLLAKNLIEENNQLKRDIANKEELINKYEKTFKFLLCNNSNTNNNILGLSNTNNNSESNNSNNQNNNFDNNDFSINTIQDLQMQNKEQIQLVQSNFRNCFYFSQRRLSLLTGLFAFICIFGTLMVSSHTNGQNNSSSSTNKGLSTRILAENQMQIEKDDFIQEYSSSKSVISSMNSSSLNKIHSSPSTEEKQLQVHFQIMKDYTIRNSVLKNRIKDNTSSNSNNNKSLMVYNNNNEKNNQKDFTDEDTQSQSMSFNQKYVSAGMEAQELIARLFKEMNMKNNQSNLNKNNLRNNNNNNDKKKEEELNNYSVQLFIPSKDEENNSVKKNIDSNNNNHNNITNNKNYEIQDSSEILNPFYEVKCKIFEVNKVYK